MPLLWSTNHNQSEHLVELGNVLEKELKLKCYKCNEDLLKCGESNYVSWWDAHCIKCNISFEIKTKASNKNKDLTGILKTTGGSYQTFTKIEGTKGVHPIIILVIYDYVDDKEKNCVSLSIKSLRYYEPFKYIVRANRAKKKKSEITFPSGSDYFFEMKNSIETNYEVDFRPF